MKDASPDEKENIEILEAEEFYERRPKGQRKWNSQKNHEQIKNVKINNLTSRYRKISRKAEGC